MANTIPYPKPDYVEDIEGSVRFLRISALTAPMILICTLTAFFLFWFPMAILSLVGIEEEPGIIVRLVLPFIIMILGINYSNNKAAKAFSSCSHCKNTMTCESHKGCEFYVCSTCKTFVRGGDFS